MSDGGGIRRNVIVVQKPSASAVDKMSTTAPVSNATHANSVTPGSIGTPARSVTPTDSVAPVTVDVSVSVASLSPPKVSSGFEQVTHSVTT